MADKEQVAEELSRLIRKQSERSGFLNISKGRAKDVDENKGTFTLVRENEDDHPDVSLNAFFESEGYFILIPKEDSVVVVGFADGNQDAFIIEASQIQKVKINIGEFEVSLDKDLLKTKIEGFEVSLDKDKLSSTNTDCKFEQTKDNVKINKGNISLEINNNEAVFNGGILKGLVKLEALVGRLNAIENKVNNLSSAFNSHKHSATGTSVSGGTVTITTGGMSAPNSISSGTLSITANADIENPKVKQ